MRYSRILQQRCRRRIKAMGIVGGELMSSHLSVPPEATSRLAMCFGVAIRSTISLPLQSSCAGARQRP